MMTIKDLSVSKELDRKAMTDVRGGGQTINSTTVANAAQTVQNLGGVVAAVQTPSATSVINASNVEDYSVKYEDYSNKFGYGPYWF
jgi:hypothetical protein